MVASARWSSKARDGSCEDVRIGLTNMGSTPLRATAAEEALRGQPLDAEAIARAAEQAAEGTEPPGDLNATPDYKRHLARVLCRRALSEAAAAVVTLRDRRGRRARRWPARATSPTARWRRAVFLAATLEQPLLLEGEAGRRQDRGRAGAGRGARARG